MRVIYTGGFLPDLGIDDDANSRFWGWLMAKNYDGQWVSIANLSLQITNAVFEGEPTECETLRAKVAELEADAERYRLLRQKVCIIRKGENAEFQIINLRPFYIAPRPDIELDAVLDAVMAQESK